MQRFEFNVKELDQFNKLVSRLFHQLHKDTRVILLSGEMGAGKTEFARQWLREAGVEGRIKSPSYSIIESYENTKIGTIHHMDLYRIAHPYELIEIGLEEYLTGQILVEWPEKGWPAEIKYDVWIKIKHQKDNDRVVVMKINSDDKKDE